MSAARERATRWLVLPLAMATWAPAWAAPERVLVVGAPGLSQPLAEGQSRELVPLSESEAARLLAAEVQRAALLRGQRRAKEARLLIGHLRLKEAAAALRGALEDFASHQTTAESCRSARTAMQDLAFVWWQRKDLERARWWAAGAGAATLDEERFPPAYVGFARKAISRPPAPRPIALITRPTGAQVTVDCKARGRAPLHLELGKAALLGIGLAGHQPWGRAMGAHEKEVRRVTLRAEPPPLLERSAPALVERLLAKQQATELWVWRPAATGRALWRYRRGGAWRRWIAASAATTAPTTQPRRATSSRFGGGKWLLASGAAASLIVGTIFGVLARVAADDLEQAARQGQTFDQTLADTEDRRDAFGITAYALWGVGAAAAVALAAWLLFEQPPAAESPRPATSLGAPFRLHF